MYSETDSDILEEKAGYTFRDKGILSQALTHSSYANEHRESLLPDYERLEFLGDAVLEMCTSAFIFRSLPDASEGEMTRMRAHLVCEEALAKKARVLGIPAHILLGRGEEGTGGRERDSIIADVCEAFIGAIYIDGGIEAAFRFIEESILDEKDLVRGVSDPKSVLQELIQSKGSGQLKYVLKSEKGPEHRKVFSVEVVYEGRVLGEGEGTNKKDAQKNAAANALLAINDKTVCI